MSKKKDFVDRFMRAAGVNLISKDGVTDDQRAVLAREAEEYLRAEGKVEWSFWQGLSIYSKAAFVVAGDRVRREHAIWSGTASQGPGAVAALMADLDDGELLADHAFATLIEKREKKGEAAP